MKQYSLPPPYLVAGNDPYVAPGRGGNAVVDKDMASISLAETIKVERRNGHTKVVVRQCSQQCPEQNIKSKTTPCLFPHTCHLCYIRMSFGINMHTQHMFVFFSLKWVWCQRFLMSCPPCSSSHTLSSASCLLQLPSVPHWTPNMLYTYLSISGYIVQSVYLYSRGLHPWP